MPGSIDELRREALADCDHPEEIERAGEVIAAALRLGKPCEVTLAPGNGTRYCFIFTPIKGMLSYETPMNGLESASVSEGGVWIARVGGYPGRNNAYPLALIGRTQPPGPTYIAEKWFPQQEELSYDVFVMEALLEVVGRRTALAAA